MRLAGLCKTERVPKGSVIVNENALGEALYIIRSGRVTVFKGDQDHPVELGQMGPGELFGEMSLIDDVLTSASVMASEDADLFVLPRHDFDKLIASDKTLAYKVYRSFCHALSEKLRQLHQKLVPEAGLSVEGA